MYKKKILYLLGAILFAAVLTSGVLDILTSGAPIASTGAPGETTCARSGCHVGSNGTDNLNTGPAILSLTSDKDFTQYIPGEWYELIVSITEPGVERFGFALTILGKNHQKTGELMITEPQRTQILQGVHQFSGREYITYQYAGTYPVEPGKGKWSFKWKAPVDAAGDIKFYLAAVSADNDGTDKGDWVYTKVYSSSLSPLATFETHMNNDYKLGYDKLQNQILIYTKGPIRETVEVNIYSSNGHLMGNYRFKNQKSFRIAAENLKSGLYFIHISDGSNLVYKRIIIY